MHVMMALLPVYFLDTQAFWVHRNKYLSQIHRHRLNILAYTILSVSFFVVCSLPNSAAAWWKTRMSLYCCKVSTQSNEEMLCWPALGPDLAHQENLVAQDKLLKGANSCWSTIQMKDGHLWHLHNAFHWESYIICIPYSYFYLWKTLTMA